MGKGIGVDMTRVLGKPRAGLMLFAQKIYPPPFPSPEETIGFADASARGLIERGIDIVFPREIISNIADARKMARKLWAQDVDSLILFVGTWVEEPVVIAAVKEVFDLPIIVWGMPMYYKKGVKETTGSLCAAAITRATLDEIGRKFKFVVGLPDDVRALEKATGYCKSASTVKMLRRARVGLIGYASMGMYPATFDHVTLRDHIGPEVVHIDNYLLIRRMEAISEEKVKEQGENMREKYFVESDVQEKDLLEVSRMYLAFKELVNEFDLNALCPKCQYEMSKYYGAVCCVPLSVLADEGLVTACEGDVHLTVTMMILHHLTGKPVYYGDTLDIRGNDKLYLSSCGFAPLTLASDPSTMGIGKHKLAFTGLRSGITLRPGRVTVARLGVRKGTYLMHISTGDAVKTELRTGYFPATELALDANVEDFMQNVLSQHYAVVHGEVKEELMNICDLLNIKPIIT